MASVAEAAAVDWIVWVEAERYECWSVLWVVVGVGAGAYVAVDADWIAVEDGEAEPLVTLGLVWGVGCAAPTVRLLLAVSASACAIEDVVTAGA
ncbi:hypothetical protein ART_0187 [Arthrobacter sp. PAMC 25486]|uniref:hypothetical protein n=1 Tax=Arthrobacter sp. PAMC 25486 TaxID=1494608 RepID=UPI000535D6F6|nr:hypothetical protein [Arthrobacter sp. PAMC 25486]AIX99785.1 hypothetical protein ART_0187 [Arthrobacter sp. PAMC 25486]